MKNPRKLIASVLALSVLVTAIPCSSESLHPTTDQAIAVDRDVPTRRRPVRIVNSIKGDRLLVANRSTGSVSVIDAKSCKVIGEWKIGSRIGDLAVWKEDCFLVAIAGDPDQLVGIRLMPNDSIKVLWRCDTIGSPNKITLIEEGGACIVGGLWSRQIAKHDFVLSSDSSAAETAKPAAVVVDLPFAVGDLLIIQEGSALLVADAFGGQWASFQVPDLSPISDGDFGSRRVVGLIGWSHQKESVPGIAVVTQPLNRLAQAVRNDVHWGLMVSNEIIIRDEQSFTESQWKESRRSPVPLGGPGEAKGDPESIAISDTLEVAIAIGGVNQVAIGDINERSFAYIPTGSRPVDCCFSKDGNRLFVINQLDDSITVVNVDHYEVSSTIALGKTPEMTDADRGERLFFDANVSHDGWMSCHSCHVEGHTSGFLNDNFSDQSFGAPKRVLSLLGHADTAPFAWNGSAKTLADQIRSSIETTMQSDRSFGDHEINAIAAFVESLPAPQSLRDARGPGRSTDLDAGKILFMQLGCAECHKAPQYTSPELKNAGLVDELGVEKFNPPSLIGVSQRQRFFHDARYSSLRELFTANRHQLGRELSIEELNQLLTFLSSL